MTTKKSSKQSVPKDDDLIPQILSQLDILNKSIQMINSDIEHICDKLNRVSDRMGL